jgi:hypothetical protein
VSAEEPVDPSRPRKRYEKPTLSEISLRPDEAVLGNCKSVSVSGPAAADCMTFGCASIGS